MKSFSLTSKIVVFFGLFLYLPFTLALQAETNMSKEGVQVNVSVTIPPSTKPEIRLFLAGTGPLGEWKPDGLPLSPAEDGTWQASFQAPVGSLIECKVTQGTWATCEKGKNGEEIPNRQILVEKGMNFDISVQKWSGETANFSTFSGDIRVHRDFPSRILKNKRPIWVYLPPHYKKMPTQRFPVLYMHDGQNLFNAGSSFGGVEWEADETAEKLIRSGTIVPLIIIGVSNTAERMSEYSPVYDDTYQMGGNGEKYGRFLIEELKPFIDKTYRTLPDQKNTGIAGSSMGGLISIYLCARFPNVFSKCGAISPSIWWANRWILDYLSSYLGPLKKTSVWLDLGTKEGDKPDEFARHLKNLRDLRDLLRKGGFEENKTLSYHEIEGATHSEAAWSARFGQILRFFYKL